MTLDQFSDGPYSAIVDALQAQGYRTLEDITRSKAGRETGIEAKILRDVLEGDGKKSTRKNYMAVLACLSGLPLPPDCGKIRNAPLHPDQPTPQCS